jgi:hypothetical protein
MGARPLSIVGSVGVGGGGGVGVAGVAGDGGGGVALALALALALAVAVALALALALALACSSNGGSILDASKASAASVKKGASVLMPEANCATAGAVPRTRSSS